MREAMFMCFAIYKAEHILSEDLGLLNYTLILRDGKKLDSYLPSSF